ncbi:MAG: lipid-A-disaccharide synthase N-terminal domain-containing protein [Bacteroidales bacterium]
MLATHFWIYAIGFTAQLFFSARILYQWIVTEKAKRVLSPPAFWILSILGSFLLFIYGLLRDDFAIILGQYIAYYIYLWNLNMQGVWKKIFPMLKLLLLLTPIVVTVIILRDLSAFNTIFFQNKEIPLWLLIFGSAGQVIFSLRFLYQFIYSASHKESTLPAGFWIMSLVGSSTIIAYAVFRLDPVLLLGQSFGFIAYIRNIIIGSRSKKNTIQ